MIPVNSSHHQSADAIGDGLRIVARCAEDGIIEALEGTSPDHFVVAVQWHPERSVEADEPSAAIFRALIEASRLRHLLSGSTNSSKNSAGDFPLEWDCWAVRHPTYLTRSTSACRRRTVQDC